MDVSGLNHNIGKCYIYKPNFSCQDETRGDQLSFCTWVSDGEKPIGQGYSI